MKFKGIKYNRTRKYYVDNVTLQYLYLRGIRYITYDRRTMQVMNMAATNSGIRSFLKHRKLYRGIMLLNNQDDKWIPIPANQPITIWKHHQEK